MRTTQPLCFCREMIESSKKRKRVASQKEKKAKKEKKAEQKEDNWSI